MLCPVQLQQVRGNADRGATYWIADRRKHAYFSVRNAGK
jgi:hypothetical protein